MPDDVYGGGGGLSTEWTGKDVGIQWRHARAVGVEELGEEAFGAGDGGLDPEFRDYQIVILDSQERELREVHTVENRFSYTYEMNRLDYGRINGSVGANRALIVRVWVRGRQNQLSEEYAEL
ncbi:MAG: hypothetical protein HQL54_13995 [Magnetococcales bacterium]|nr:hypothetical protein [Magnetococcales bacterium]